ncbi:MAG TPA: DUF3226 domain-containing protein [Longimicrobium sp.]|jgi:hypothetical protein
MNAVRVAPGPAGSRVLWVEGKDDDAVVQSLCKSHRLPQSFSVREKGGFEKLLAGITLEIRAPGLDRFGIVVDANGDAAARFAQIRRVVEPEGYPTFPFSLPNEGLVVPATGPLPRVGIWIMPDNGSPGALEDFGAALVPQDDVLWKRAGEAVDGIPEQHRRFPAGRRSKAHMHTWLAWQEQPGSPMGQAIGKGDLDAHAPAAQRFVAWLRRLMVDEAEGESAG